MPETIDEEEEIIDERVNEEYEEELGEKEEDDDDDEDEPLPPPPPEGEEKELLFLIEFLVESLKLFPENMDLENIDPCCLQGPTSVILTFLHFPPMKMSEKDLDANRRTGENFIQYNVGKSLMFALTESQFEEPPPIFLALSATKEMPHAFRFSNLNVGKTKIELSELFKQVFEKYDETPSKTVSKSIKDTYSLKGEKNTIGGEISLYIRLTCIGENIVTEFKRADDPTEPTLYKNIDSEKVYICKETVGASEDSPAIKLPGWDGTGKKCQEKNVIKTRPPDPYDENCEEIFAEINGSAITIKVEKNKRKEHKEFHISEFCDCNIPLPQNLVAGMSDLSLSPVLENVKLNASDISQRDPRVGLDSSNNLVFHIPPVEALALPGGKNFVTYNVKTCQEGKTHGHDMQSFRIIKDNDPNSPPPTLPNDPDKDVFILRIIKKGKLEKGKGSLELEFKTPKEKIELPKRKPYMVDHSAGPEKNKAKKKKDKKKK